MFTDEERRFLIETRKELEQSIARIDLFLGKYYPEPRGSKKESDTLVKNYEEQYISRYLTNMGVPINMRGFKYISTALIMMMKCPQDHVFVTKEVYPQIAKRYKTTWENVEKAIRCAIESTWKRGNKEALVKLFGSSYKENRPSNSAFLLHILEDIGQKY